MNKPQYRQADLNLNRALVKPWHLDGFIRLKKQPHVRSLHWMADTVGDGVLLGRIIGKIIFPDSEYESVLTKCSEKGFGLETIDEDVLD